MINQAEFRAYAPLVRVVAGVCLGLALLAWNQGVRRYASTGS